MTTYYILFEHSNDPRGEKPVEVHTDQYDAESAQLNRQQDLAIEHNKRRAKTYRDGHAVGEKLTADFYKNYFSIQEVQQRD